MRSRTWAIGLSPRDIEILITLSVRVRVLSLPQIRRCWWRLSHDANDVCFRRMRLLEQAGLLVKRRITAIDVGQLSGPLACSAPGQYVPDLGALAWQLRKRWRAGRIARSFSWRLHVCPTVWRSPPGPNSTRFPGFARFGRGRHVPRAYRTHPALIEHWIDEDRFAPLRRGQKLPDAVIASDLTSLPTLVLEFGGDYPKSRLQDFHDDNESRGLPYQIW